MYLWDSSLDGFNHLMNAGLYLAQCWLQSCQNVYDKDAYKAAVAVQEDAQPGKTRRLPSGKGRRAELWLQTHILAGAPDADKAVQD